MGSGALLEFLDEAPGNSKVLSISARLPRTATGSHLCNDALIRRSPSTVACLEDYINETLIGNTTLCLTRAAIIRTCDRETRRKDNLMTRSSPKVSAG